VENKCKLISFEGIDGSGKSTNIKLIYNYLKEKGLNVKVFTFVTKRGEFFKTLSTVIDDISQQLYCDLFAFERYKSINKRLSDENMKKYDVILCNRYLYTDLAYTLGYGADISSIEKIIDKAMVPDLNLLFDIDPNIAIDRIYNRNKEVWKRQENIELLTSARSAYLCNTEKYNLNVINTDRSADKTFEECLKHIDNILKY